VMRGWFVVDGPGNGTGQPAEMETEEDQESKAIANLMLLWAFPVASIVKSPLTIILLFLITF